MKIAATSTGPTLDDNVEARFGRCAYFLIIDTDTMHYDPIENPNTALGGGAGIQSAQLMSEKGVTAVLTGNCGPNAFAVFGRAGIQVIVGVSGPVRDAVEQFKAGAFSSASGPNVASHFGVNAPLADPTATGQPTNGPLGRGSGVGLGMGGGRGMGGGKGMGRGGGMGRGAGRGGGMGRGIGMLGLVGMPSTGSASAFPQGAGAQMNPEQELAALKQHVELLEQQKRQINNRIAQVKGGRKAVAVVDSGKCAGCGICADVCPVNAIKVNGQAIVNGEACTGCAACVSECPNEAIIIAQRKLDKHH